MSALDLGDRLTASAPPPEELVLTRTDIVRYAGAAGDFNPVHHSEPYAQEVGHTGVFAMGLLPGGILAARAQSWASPDQLAEVDMRFGGLVLPDVTYLLVSEVHGPVPSGEGISVELRLVDAEGSTKVRVRAVIRTVR